MDGPAGRLGQHLQLVHLTVIVVASVLLINQLSSSYRRAQEELNVITNVATFAVSKSDGERSLRAGFLEDVVRDILQIEEEPQARKRAGSTSTPDIGIITVPISPSGPSSPIKVVAMAPEAFLIEGNSQLDRPSRNFDVFRYWDVFRAFRPAERKIEPKSWPMDDGTRSLGSFSLDGIWHESASPPLYLNQFSRLWDVSDRISLAYLRSESVYVTAYVVSEAPSANTRYIQEAGSPLRDTGTVPDVGWHLVPVPVRISPEPRNDSAVSIDQSVVFARLLKITGNDIFGSSGLDTFSRGFLALVRDSSGSIEEVSRPEDLRLGDFVVSIECVYTHAALRIQDYLMNQAGASEVGLGKFEQSFPALTAFLDDIGLDQQEPMPLETLRKLLSKAAIQEKEPVEIVGLKIESGSLQLWGAIVLLAVQLYLILGMREFLRRLERDESGVSVPWILLYSGRVTWFILFATLVALPASAPILGLFNTFQVGITTYRAFILPTGNILLCAWSALEGRRMLRTVSNYARQKHVEDVREITPHRL